MVGLVVADAEGRVGRLDEAVELHPVELLLVHGIELVKLYL